MKGNKSLFFLFAAGVMILLLYSLHAYFFWWMYDDPKVPFAIDFMVAVIGFIYMSSGKIAKHFRASVLIPFLLIWMLAAWNPPSLIWIILKCPFTLLILLVLDKTTLQSLLKVWTNLFAIILLVSIIAWPLAFIGVLPSFGLINFGEDEGYLYQNFGLCLVNINLRDFDVVRFCSIFLEPGHVAMIGAFTLYLNRFEFKKWTTWVILIVCLITLSLAGYVLIVLGYIMQRAVKGSFGKSVRVLVGVSIVLCIGYFIATTYKGGGNLINMLIIERLALDEEKGIEGNNRVSGSTDTEFERFITSPEFLTGMSKKDYQDSIENATIAGAGYKMFLMQNGIFGAALALLGYFLLANKALDKKFVYLFFLLYIIAFIQRAWPATHIWLFLYVFGTAVEPEKVLKKRLRATLKMQSQCCSPAPVADSNT